MQKHSSRVHLSPGPRSRGTPVLVPLRTHLLKSSKPFRAKILSHAVKPHLRDQLWLFQERCGAQSACLFLSHQADTGLGLQPASLSAFGAHAMPSSGHTSSNRLQPPRPHRARLSQNPGLSSLIWFCGSAQVHAQAAQAQHSN